MEEDEARSEDNGKDDEGRSKESGGRIFCPPGLKTRGVGGVGGTSSCPSSGKGDDDCGGGGSAPDDGAEEVGIGLVSS